MKNLDIAKLADIYRACGLQHPQAIEMQNRLQAFEKIAEASSTKYLLDLLRVFIRKEQVDRVFEENLVAQITEFDAVFPQEKNRLEIQAAAGAILHIVLQSRTKLTDTAPIVVAVALEISQEFCQKSIYSALFQFAHDQFMLIGHELRTGATFQPKKKLLADLEETIDALSNLQSTEQEDLASELGIEEINQSKISRLGSLTHFLGSEVLGLIKCQQLEINSLREESNIQWWLFKGISNQTNRVFQQLKEEAAFEIAADLVELSSLTPWPLSLENFIIKAHSFVELESETRNLEYFVSKLPVEAMSTILGQYDVNQTKGLCIVLEAFSEFTQNPENDMWRKLFQKKYPGMLEIGFTREKFSYQLFCELAFAKYLKENAG